MIPRVIPNLRVRNGQETNGRGSTWRNNLLPEAQCLKRLASLLTLNRQAASYHRISSLRQP